VAPRPVVVVLGAVSPGVEDELTVRPVRGVPAVRLPPGLEVRVRVGAAEEEAVEPKESPPPTLAVAELTAEKPPKLEAVVVEPPDRPNPPKAGAGVVVGATDAEGVTNPVAVVLAGARPEENPPKPDEAEAAVPNAGAPPVVVLAVTPPNPPKEGVVVVAPPNPPKEGVVVVAPPNPPKEGAVEAATPNPP